MILGCQPLLLVLRLRPGSRSRLDNFGLFGYTSAGQFVEAIASFLQHQAAEPHTNEIQGADGLLYALHSHFLVDKMVW